MTLLVTRMDRIGHVHNAQKTENELLTVSQKWISSIPEDKVEVSISLI